jgi:hypothetical protein
MGKIQISKPKRRKKKAMTPEEAREARREYQRKYYLAHKEKAKEYQRLYNLTHKKKQRPKGAGVEYTRDNVKGTYNTRDLMHAPVEKTLKMLEHIVSGRRYFTM